MKRSGKRKNSAQPKGIFSDFFSDLGRAISGSEFAVKINGHEFKKDKKNNMSLSITEQDVRTSIHFIDSQLGIEQTRVNKKDDK